MVSFVCSLINAKTNIVCATFNQCNFSLVHISVLRENNFANSNLLSLYCTVFFLVYRHIYIVIKCIIEATASVISFIVFWSLLVSYYLCLSLSNSYFVVNMVTLYVIIKDNQVILISCFIITIFVGI